MRQRVLFAEQQEDAEVNMTPMLDVVFIMLIFFIVSTSFVREAGIDVERPSADTGASQKNEAVMMALSEDGQIWLDEKTIDVRMIRASIESIRGDQAEMNVVVQADKDSSTGQLVALLDQLRLAGVPYIVSTKSK